MKLEFYNQRHCLRAVGVWATIYVAGRSRIRPSEKELKEMPGLVV